MLFHIWSLSANGRWSPNCKPNCLQRVSNRNLKRNANSQSFRWKKLQSITYLIAWTTPIITASFQINIIGLQFMFWNRINFINVNTFMWYVCTVRTLDSCIKCVKNFHFPPAFLANKSIMWLILIIDHQQKRDASKWKVKLKECWKFWAYDSYVWGFDLI